MDVAVPHPPPHESSAAGSARAVPMAVKSGSTEVSSNAPFFLFFLSFFPNPPHSSMSAAAAVAGSLASSSAPRSPKSKPVEVVVVFFLFFLLPPKDQIPLSPPSRDVSLVSLELLALSVVAVSAAAVKSHLLFVFQLLPHSPNPKLLPVFLVPVSPKLRSSFGVSPRLISSKAPVEGSSIAVVGSAPIYWIS